MKKVWFLFLFILAVSCSDDSTNPTDGDVKYSKTQSDWLSPVTLGNKWVYLCTNNWIEEGFGTYNLTVEITSFLGSMEWINTGRDGKADTYEYTMSGMPEYDEESDEIIGYTGISKQIIRGNSKYFYQITSKPNEPIEPYISIDLDNDDPLSKFKFLAIEDVTINGKVFKNCYKYEYKYSDAEFPSETYISIFYFKKGIGLIKTDSYTLSNEEINDRYTLELISYSIK